MKIIFAPVVTSCKIENDSNQVTFFRPVLMEKIHLYILIEPKSDLLRCHFVFVNEKLNQGESNSVMNSSVDCPRTQRKSFS